MSLRRRTMLFTLPLLLSTGWPLAGDMPPGGDVPYALNPYAGMYGSMGNVYSPYYRQFQPSGMSGMEPAAGRAPEVPYLVSPYAGMYGSMGNVYSPYYRQFHPYGMGGMTGTAAGRVPEVPYLVSPYAGMYGSMGNVYSPYYRQFHPYGMGGMTGTATGGNLTQGRQQLYPYFLPPTMGAM